VRFSCARKVRATKRFTVHRVPNALTVQLKRYSAAEEKKVVNHIVFPERLNLRSYMSATGGPPVWYVLSSILVHSGLTVSSGHYYSFVKRPGSNGDWFQVNDSSVTSVSLDAVLRAQAYLLFYTLVKPASHSKVCKTFSTFC